MAEQNYTEQTVQAEYRAAIARLTPKFGEGEARAMARFIFEQIKGWTQTDLLVRADQPVSQFIHNKIDQTITRALNDEPLQYIFGAADFYGMKFSVSPDVLIPRPETAELVDIIVKQNPAKDLRVVDFGTGSGCIAIALARNLVFPHIVAVDNSANALKVAQANASSLHTNIELVEADILSLNQSSPSALNTEFDIIVSNPPYIAESERATMHNNVLLHEPASALFVPDNDPLLFYKAILQYAAKRLSDSGTIYFEINQRFTELLKTEAGKHGFGTTEILKDSFGLDRFAIIRR